MKPIVPRSSTASSTVDTQDFLGGDHPESDILVRIRSGGQFNSFSIASTSTETVRDDLSAYFVRHTQDIGLLCSVIFWQKRTIDYQALHTAFLLNSLSEENFEKEAGKFSVRQKEVQPELIASVVERLDSLTGLKFDTSDYADYFQCSQRNVMAGLGLLNSPHYTAMLPSLAQDE